MKATRANLLGEFTGKLDGLIYYRLKPGGRIYVRRQFSLQNHPSHSNFREAQRAIYALQPSGGYKQDLKDYLLQYNQMPQNKSSNASTWTNLYIKLMFAMQKLLTGQVDLATITRQQIEEQNLPCRSVKDAVEAGLLPEVKGYERFDKVI
jgi:hypothetical protein